MTVFALVHFFTVYFKYPLSFVKALYILNESPFVIYIIIEIKTKIILNKTSKENLTIFYLFLATACIADILV